MTNFEQNYALMLLKSITVQNFGFRYPFSTSNMENDKNKNKKKSKKRLKGQYSLQNVMMK